MPVVRNIAGKATRYFILIFRSASVVGRVSLFHKVFRSIKIVYGAFAALIGHRHLFYVAEVGVTVYPVVDVIH